MGKHLNQAEKDYIFSNAANLGDKEIADKLTELRGSKVSKEVIGNFRRKSGLDKTRGRNSKLKVPQVQAVNVPQAGEGVETTVPGEAPETNV